MLIRIFSFFVTLIAGLNSSQAQEVKNLLVRYYKDDISVAAVLPKGDKNLAEADSREMQAVPEIISKWAARFGLRATIGEPIHNSTTYGSKDYMEKRSTMVIYKQDIEVFSRDLQSIKDNTYVLYLKFGTLALPDGSFPFYKGDYVNRPRHWGAGGCLFVRPEKKPLKCEATCGEALYTYFNKVLVSYPGKDNIHEGLEGLLHKFEKALAHSLGKE